MTDSTAETRSAQEAAGAPRVVVVGSINADMVARCSTLPRPGETVAGSSFALESGGKGANQAVAAARMQARVAMIGRIGRDDHGHRLLAALEREGIDCRGVERDAAQPTGVAMISVAGDGENCIVVVPGANALVSASQVEALAPAFDAAQVVVAQLETPVEAATAAFALARKAGARTVLNAAPARAALPRDLLTLVDWLVVNETEALSLAGLASEGQEPERHAAQALLACGVGAVIVTLGSRGALLATRQGIEHFPAVAVRAVDTTGAGDAFVGAFCAFLACGNAAREAIRQGQAAAALAVSRAGVQSALPRRSELPGVPAQAEVGARSAPAGKAADSQPIKVLFDTDPGIDDTMALLMLHRDPRCRLVGITTVFGNAPLEATTRNALAVCERFGIGVAVARGAERALSIPPRAFPESVHGRGGLGGVVLPTPARQVLAGKPAHEFICDMARSAPGEITLVAVGPLTNLALALEHDPALPGLVRKVVVMGGAFGFNGHSGNISPCAEFNISSDPHAADRVFTAPWPVEIVGLDVTQEVVMSTAWLDELGRRGGEAGRFMREITRFYERHTVGGIWSHDATAAACALDPAPFVMRPGVVRVVTEGIAIGQTIQAPAGREFPPGAWEGLPQQKICVGVDAARLRAEFMALFTGLDA